MPTLIRPMSSSSEFFHAHCFQFLWSVSTPSFPASPFWPPGPVGPIMPLSPFAPSRPSRPGNPLCPLRPGTPGRPGDPCRHVLVFCVIQEVSIVNGENMRWQFGEKDQRCVKSFSNSSGGFDNYDFFSCDWEGRGEGTQVKILRIFDFFFLEFSLYSYLLSLIYLSTLPWKICYN